MSALIIIPARLHSTRLPQKLLLRETGHSLLWHTFKNAIASKAIGACVATDSREIFNEVESFQGLAVMTGEHPTGTSRIIDAIGILGRSGSPWLLKSDIIINLQADEPLLTPDDINYLIYVLENSNAPIATLCFEITEPDEILNPNRIKVVRGHSNNALYFSRYGIPFGVEKNKYGDDISPKHTYYQHVGVYAFRKDILDDLINLPKSSISEAESLEQLAWMEWGYPIVVGDITHPTNGIDTREDYDLFVEEIRNAQSSDGG